MVIVYALLRAALEPVNVFKRHGGGCVWALSVRD